MPIDYKKYCKDWKLRSRFIRHYRAQNKCECCGVKNHKLILRGWFDGVEVYQDLEGAIFRADNSRYITHWYIGKVDKQSKNKFIKVVLTVAHLDHDIKNNSFFNLKAMCQKCHNSYDASHRKQTRMKKTNQLQLFN